MEKSKLEDMYLAEKIIEEAIKITASGCKVKFVCEDMAVREAVKRMEESKNTSKRKSQLTHKNRYLNM